MPKFVLMDVRKKTISILGCGWLGVPLARHFLSKGYSVKGSVTSAEKIAVLNKYGILPYRIVLSDVEDITEGTDFFWCDVLIISIPPPRTGMVKLVFTSQIRRLITFILKSGVQKVIFISSTSVYPGRGQVAREDEPFTPDKSNGLALIGAENLLREQTGFKTTILRFGGIIGADRIPAMLFHRLTQPIGNTPVNLIHRDDCIGIISAVTEQELWGETLNACCPDHPMKKDFYEKAAIQAGLPAPLISTDPTDFKTIDSSKLMRLLSYQFIYQSPMDF